MLFKPSFVTALLIGLCEVSAAVVGKAKRQTTSDDFALYAYSTNLDGLPIYYADGSAYIGTVVPSGVSEAQNITFTPPDSDTTTTWPISPNATTWVKAPVFYINPTAGAFESAGFTNNTSDLPAGAVTTGFTFYGQSVMYQDSTGMMQAKFWADETEEEGVWKLMWNSDGVGKNGSVPVVVKSTPPSATTKMM